MTSLATTRRRTRRCRGSSSGSSGPIKFNLNSRNLNSIAIQFNSIESSFCDQPQGADGCRLADGSWAEPGRDLPQGSISSDFNPILIRF